MDMQATIDKMRLEDLVADIRIYAAKPRNYENGWDVLVEAWDDQQIIEAIGTSRSLPYAKNKLGKIMRDIKSYGDEIRATAF